MNNVESVTTASLKQQMVACSRDVLEICDALVDEADAVVLPQEEQRGVVELVERAVQAALHKWCETAGRPDQGPEEAFEDTIAVMEVAECTMVTYLAQRYGLASETPLTWTPHFLPLRWATPGEQSSAIRFLTDCRFDLIEHRHSLTR